MFDALRKWAAYNDRFGTDIHLNMGGRFLYSNWCSKIFTIIFTLYIIMNLLLEFRDSQEKPQFQIKDIKTTALSESNRSISFDNFPIVFHFWDDALNEN